MAKMFEKQVKALVSEKESLQNAKRVGKSNAASQEVASNQIEKLGISVPKSVRDYFAKEQKENAISIAESVVSNFVALFPDVYKYTFEEARQYTQNFTHIYTTSEENYKGVETIGTKTIYTREIEANTPDAVLRSFESYKLRAEALRIEDNRKKRDEAKTLVTLEATAKILGVSIDVLLAMKANKE